MNIFLRRIPANTKHIEIANYITPALSNGLFKKPGRILNIEILALRDIRVNSFEYHGLVTLDSEWAVKQAVKGLKNRRLNGRFVVVRPYYHRSAENDPRKQAEHPARNRGFIEKRHGDRRRGQFLEIIANASEPFNSEESLPDAVNHQHFQVTFIVPSAIEMKLAECFVNFELEKTASAVKPDEKESYRITRFLTELEGPEKKSRRFLFFVEKSVLSELLEKIKREFSDNEIYYWITPVIDYGTI